MKTRITSLLLILFIAAGSPAALACGPFITDVLFTLKRHADLPLKPYYASGEPGVVPATFQPMSLVLFHRTLNNGSFTDAEIQQAAAALEHKIFYRRSFDESIPDHQETSEPEARWFNERAKVTGEAAPVDVYKQLSSYHYFVNCLPDSFRTAAETLADRIGRFGNSPDVIEWVKGQDAVFANCSEQAELPALVADGPEWLKHDRAYQIAAAKFYRTEFESSRADLDAIAADSSNPWSKTARYVAARTFIRQASLMPASEDPAAAAAEETARKAFLQQADERIRSIIDDPAMSEMHSSAAGLLGLVRFRMDPETRRIELGKILADPNMNANLLNDLFDYGILISRIYDEARSRGEDIDRKEAEAAGRNYDYNYVLKLRDVPAQERVDELTDWIFTYMAVDGFSHAKEKYKETGKAEWLVAAISKAEPGADGNAELLEAAGRVESTSPAFTTVQYHRIRLALASGRIDDARAYFAAIAEFDKLPVSTQNALLMQQTTTAKNLEEYLALALRSPAMFTWNSWTEEPDDVSGTRLEKWAKRKMFDIDAAAFFNDKAPLSVLKKASENPAVPEYLQKMLLSAAWTRAFIINDTAMERELAPRMANAFRTKMPEFAEYSSARRAADREALSLRAILRNPVVQLYVPTGYGRENSEPEVIDSIRGNWWCSPAEQIANSVAMPQPEHDVLYPNFLTAAEKTAAKMENEKLAKTGAAATALTKRTVAFANKYPRHAKTPELLHLAVRSTRYGCKDADTGTFSKQAFDILHSRYRSSAWTKRTPYWFN